MEKIKKYRKCPALLGQTTSTLVGPPEKVFPAVDVGVFDEALFPERRVARGAGEALGVPGLVEHLEDEPVQDEAAARSALWYRGWGKKK